jgi:carboxymethylenebutenolidase
VSGGDRGETIGRYDPNVADLTIDIDSGPLDVYLAGDGEPSPAVVVLHEAFGLNDDIRRLTDRVAEFGYVAVAPDLVEGGRIRCLAQAFRDLLRGGGPTVDRAIEVVDWVSSRDDVETDRVGVIGFCLGGGLAFMVGTSGRVRAVASNYGKAPSDRQLATSCPVIASYGANDRYLRSEPARVDAALSAADVAHDVTVYPGVGHSFLNQPEGHRISRALSRPYLGIGYDADAAADAWLRIESFFAQHV